MDNDISKSIKKKVVINELVKGQEAATKLKFLLQNQKNYYPFGDGSLYSYKLAANVLRSFTEALSIISQPPGGCDDDFLNHSAENGLPLPVVVSGNHLPSGDCSTSGGIKKSSLPAKGGRGCYKRRKNEETWSIVSPTIDDDNHSWRKYGQKEIMNSEFPRSYLRCKFKNDQGCLATKQVQKTQENPDMYQITYIGIHTCNTTLKNEVVLVNSDSDEVKVLTPSLTIKQEPSKVMESDDNADALQVLQSLALEFGDIDFYFDEN